MAGETSTAVTCPNRRAAASANCPVPVPRSTTVELGVQALCREGVQVLGRVRVALLPVEAGHEGRVEVFGSRVCQFVDHP